ncbi:MAG: CopG family ribbon-helix-helix protein [Chloroflexota bacterium]
MRPSRTVTISLPPDVADEVDELAADEHRTRSELLREAFRQYATRRKRWDSIFAYGERKARAAGLTTEEAVASTVAAYRRKHAPRQ